MKDEVYVMKQDSIQEIMVRMSMAYCTLSYRFRLD